MNCPFPNSSGARSLSPQPGGGGGDGTEWAVMPGEACVHSVNGFVASPGGQRDLLSLSSRLVLLQFLFILSRH